MADVWNIAQSVKAEDFYKNSNMILGKAMFTSDIMNANNIADVCNQMTATFEEIIADQNEYYLEIDAQISEIEKLQNELTLKIQTQTAEREKIVSGAGEEGLTDEDRENLEKIDGELATFRSETSSQITTLRSNVASLQSGIASDLSKTEIATDYGSTAIEKGKPLAETQDKRKSFWRKTFGGWDKSAERAAGKKAVEAGTDLLEQVRLSSELDKNIQKRTKFISTKSV